QPRFASFVRVHSLSFSCVVNIRNECYAFDAKKIEVDLMTLTIQPMALTLLYMEFTKQVMGFG
ncbi:MAG: hypothetical protein VX078_12765, partial [Pseudomonadota bacterium]|nr:hypothetical protein [Pseudomonadota bacterium]